MPTHVTNYESDEGIPCQDHTGDCRWTDTRAIWAAEIWTPLVTEFVSFRKRRPAKTVKAHAGSVGSAGGARISKTWTWIVAIGRHVLCCEGEKRGCFCSGCDGVVGPGGCCEHAFDASGEAQEEDDDDVAAAASHTHTYCKHMRHTRTGILKRSLLTHLFNPVNGAESPPHNQSGCV